MKNMIMHSKWSLKWLKSISESGKDPKIYDENQIDVLITDIKMPKMDGIELVKKIQERKKPTETIIISGHGDFKEAYECLSIGCYAFFKKPLDLYELVETVRTSMYEVNIKFGMYNRKIYN